MKVEHRIVLLSVAAGMFAGGLDGIIASLLFYEGPLLDLLVFDVPRREFYVRSLILLTFLAFGVILSMDFARRRKAEEALAASNRMKDLFIDIMGHDLVNYVGVMKGLVEVMKDEALPEETRMELGMMDDSARKMEEMIVGATELSRVQATEEVSKREMDLVPIVREAIEEFEGEAKKKGIEIQFNAEGSVLAPVSPFIKDVFFNLVSNAVKYSPEKGRVTVDLSEQDDAVRFMVMDKGEGIADEHKGKIFERFGRRYKEGVKGTGLGLAIVKRVAELHGGRVWVEDNPGGGSVFHVEIPRKRRSA